jgi:protein SCO1/2
MVRSFLAASLLALVFLAGCHSGQEAQSAASNVKVYHLRGKVVSIDEANGILVVDGEAIPGFMEAMTMPYQLKNPRDAATLHPGDEITADVLVSKGSAQTVVLDHVVVVAQTKPGSKPAALHRAPAHAVARRS